MPILNAAGEICDFVNESQFEGGETAYACVAFSAALVKYAGKPGTGPTGTGEQVDQLADYWYGKEEGSYAASNTNGMSLDAEYMLLRGMGLRFYPLPITPLSSKMADIVALRAWLRLGFPVLICGAESGMLDLDLGGVVPYSWPPSGNHCIVACGIAPDGNLLVRDAASIGASGVRPGPRRYDVSKLQLVSGTAIQVPWLPAVPVGFDPTKEDSVIPLDISMPEVATLFEEVSPTQWKSKATGCILHDGLLADYKANGRVSLDYLGDVVQNEVYLAADRVMQRYARGVRIWERNVVTSAPLYDGPGVDPLVPKLEATLTAADAANKLLTAQIAALQAAPMPVVPTLTPVELAALEQLAAAFGKKIV